MLFDFNIFVLSARFMALLIREISSYECIGGSAIMECAALKLAERWPRGLQEQFHS
jgi:hypothetical protein